MSKMHETRKKGNSQSLHTQLNEIIQFIEAAVNQRAALHEVEAGLWCRILRLGCKILEMFIQLHGDDDVGEEVYQIGVG